TYNPAFYYLTSIITNLYIRCMVLLYRHTNHILSSFFIEWKNDRQPVYIFFIYEIKMSCCRVEDSFFASFIHCYFVAFVVVIGGTIIGSIGSFITGEAPLTSMSRIAKSLRIWAIVAAIGRTFDAIANFEKGMLDGSTIDLFKQVMLILSAMGGVKTAILLISWITQEDVT